MMELVINIVAMLIGITTCTLWLGNINTAMKDPPPRVASPDEVALVPTGLEHRVVMVRRGWRVLGVREADDDRSTS